LVYSINKDKLIDRDLSEYKIHNRVKKGVRNNMQKILVIEDDDTINRLLFDLLKDRYDVTQAYDGTEGKSLLESESFDLLLLDLMLPGVSGEELISTIREQSSVPIIVVTAKAEVNVLANVLKIGANDYIAKPFNAIEVLARVEARLRSTDSKSYPNNCLLKIYI